MADILGNILVTLYKINWKWAGFVAALALLIFWFMRRKLKSVGKKPQELDQVLSSDELAR